MSNEPQQRMWETPRRRRKPQRPREPQHQHGPENKLATYLKFSRLYTEIKLANLYLLSWFIEYFGDPKDYKSDVDKADWVEFFNKLEKDKDKDIPLISLSYLLVAANNLVKKENKLFKLKIDKLMK
jgi:hypothetical protein